ncbi:uncharacterized protein LOC133920628 [Phragmites australis]|uniref:uncharacterized protein LOC133920628 n=1 Tax=Phragmites australis TaxID=29695 RepID=UPI002D777EA5|nr:uncharacterized protein LOC133920628 [Phragmites australis]
MAEELRRWVAGMTRKPCPRSPFPPSMYPTMLEKVEGMKKVGAPTEETSKALVRIENMLKTYHRVWEANERQVQGLLRNGTKFRAYIAFVTVGSAFGLAKGADVAYKFIKG